MSAREIVAGELLVWLRGQSSEMVYVTLQGRPASETRLGVARIRCLVLRGEDCIYGARPGDVVLLKAVVNDSEPLW